MEEQWVLLGRVPRVAAPDSDAEHAAASDFSVPVALPPLVAVLTATRSAHPDRGPPDKYGYVLAASTEGLLLFFSADEPHRGPQFGADSGEGQLIVARGFRAVEGVATATAERIPNRPPSMLSTRHMLGIGIASFDHGHGFMVAELVLKGGDFAKIFR